MDGDLRDASGHGLDGQAFGSLVPTVDGAGNIGGALAFNGDFHALVPGSSTNNRAAGTINLWMRADATSSPERCHRSDLAFPYACQYNIFAKLDDAHFPKFRAQLGGFGGLGAVLDTYYFVVNGEPSTFVPGGNYGFDTWHMYTFVWTSSSKQTYLDGVLLFSVPNTLQSPSGDLYLGYNSENDREALEGAMDDLRIYSRALSGEEVGLLFAEKANPGTPNPVTVDDCKNNGWQVYGFRNQGQCIRYVNTGVDSR